MQRGVARKLDRGNDESRPRSLLDRANNAVVSLQATRSRVEDGDDPRQIAAGAASRSKRLEKGENRSTYATQPVRSGRGGNPMTTIDWGGFSDRHVRQSDSTV